MRRFGVALSCLLLTTGLVGLSACTSSDQATPTTSAPVVREAGAGGFGPGQLATWVLEGAVKAAGGQGYSFLSDLLSGDDVKVDTTTQKLDAIQSQLNGIDNRLSNIQRDVQNIEGALAKSVFQDRLLEMSGWNNRMISLYRNRFQPIACAAWKVAEAKESAGYSQGGTLAAATISTNPSATIQTTGPCTSTTSQTSTSTSAAPSTATTPADPSTTLQTLRDNFEKAFIAVDPYAVLADQHNELYPQSPVVSSVLKLYGEDLESKGYATAADSQQIQDLYLILSDQEALTALLVLEYDKMFAPDAVERHTNEYVGYRQQEVDNLAQEIPSFQIKVGNQLYSVPTELQEQFGAWLPMDNGKQIGTFSATAIAAQYPGWSVPTELQLTALYNGTQNVNIALAGQKLPPNRAATHLGSIFLYDGQLHEDLRYDAWAYPAYWTSEISGLSTNQRCYSKITQDAPQVTGRQNKQYNFHRVGVMTGADAIAIKNLPDNPVPENFVTVGKDDDTDLCWREMVSTYDNVENSAGVMLTRTVDPQKDNYMAERSTPQ